jgi:hypothetical protein
MKKSKNIPEKPKGVLGAPREGKLPKGDKNIHTPIFTFVKHNGDEISMSKRCLLHGKFIKKIITLYHIIPSGNWLEGIL